MTRINAADKYNYIDDIIIITTYFNPNTYKTKCENYKIFIKNIKASGLRFLTIEGVFTKGQDFALTESENVVRISAGDIMWQKERLLNVAISKLPGNYKKVVWLDCDILFENPDWAVETSRLLDIYPVVQLFDRAYRLPPQHLSYTGKGLVYNGFASIYLQSPNRLVQGNFDRHGHTGFAWAARREILELYGLYDSCITGSGDHWMAHAFCGDWESPCVHRIFGDNEIHRYHAIDWAKNIYKDVRARIGCVPGAILHLWHGNKKDRKYEIRNTELAGFAFDPRVDIKIGKTGCWEWNSKKIELHQWAKSYFTLRQEDGKSLDTGNKEDR